MDRVPVIVYAKVGEMAYDRNSNPYSPDTLKIEQYVGHQWIELKNVTEVDVSEGWAKITDFDNPVFVYYGSYYTERTIRGFFRIVPCSSS